LAEKEGTPVIVVTGNYRVNIFGFMNHEDLQSDEKDGLSGNYGRPLEKKN
jgi:para-nitrobenzyl esterase